MKKTLFIISVVVGFVLVSGLSQSVSATPLYEAQIFDTGSYVNLVTQDNYGNYWFNKDYHLWQDFFFYSVLILFIGVYFFFKTMRFVFDLFFKH